jgi:hypothetical protein
MPAAAAKAYGQGDGQGDGHGIENNDDWGGGSGDGDGGGGGGDDEGKENEAYMPDGHGSDGSSAAARAEGGEVPVLPATTAADGGQSSGGGAAAAAAAPPPAADGGGHGGGTPSVDLQSIPDSPQKAETNPTIYACRFPFADCIPLGLDSLESDSDSSARKNMSLSAFVQAEIESVLPKLLSTEDLDDREFQGFIEFVLNKLLSVWTDTDSTPYGWLTREQLETLSEGKCVAEEVVTLMCNWVVRATGGLFWTFGDVLSGCPPALSGHLARTDVPKAIVFSSELLTAAEAAGRNDRTHQQAFMKWLDALKKKSITRLDRLLFMRCTSRHFTVVDLQKNVSRKRFWSRIADSSCKNATNEPGLLDALNGIIAELFPRFSVQPGLSHEFPLQNEKNNCAFHAIQSQASFLSGKIMSTDTATCRRDAARLRAYTVLLVHADMRRIVSNHLPDLADLLRQWQARRVEPQALPDSALTASAADAPGAEGLDRTSDVKFRSADMDLCRLAIVQTGALHIRRIVAN